MGIFDWLKSDNEEVEDYGDLEIDPIKERLEERKWIRVVFNLPLLNKNKFCKDIKIIEEETGWNAKEDYDKIKNEGITNFQVGGSFNVEEFLKLRESILKAKARLSKSKKNPIWYVTQIEYSTGDEIDGTFTNLIQAFDIGDSLLTPLLEMNFFLEKLEELNKKDKNFIKKILGIELEKIELSNTSEGIIY